MLGCRIRCVVKNTVLHIREATMQIASFKKHFHCAEFYFPPVVLVLVSTLVCSTAARAVPAASVQKVAPPNLCPFKEHRQ